MTPPSLRPATAARARATVSLGLYRLKPWYGRQLLPVLNFLNEHRVSPNVVSSAGVVVAGGGGLVLGVTTAGLLAGVLVLAAAAIRLACANLDGNLARRRRPNRFGPVVNELGDRLADLALLVGLAVHLPAPLGWGVLLAASAPSWVALAVAAAGGARLNGGPVGKTERAALCVLAAATGAWMPIGIAIAVGSGLTALVRLRVGASDLRATALSIPTGALTGGRS